MAEKERRRFFRLEDSIKLSYRALSPEEEQQASIERFQSPVAALFSLDKRIAELIHYYQVQMPELGELVGLLNKKIDSVIDLLAVESGLLHRIAYTVHEVNVSACGIAFKTEEYFEKNASIGLDLILTPDNQHISAIGKVVSCVALAPQGEGEPLSYFLRIDFDKIETTDQEMLIQHLVKRQLVLYREQKNAVQVQ